MSPDAPLLRLRPFVLLLGSAALVALLAGCGGGATDTSTGPPTGPTGPTSGEVQAGQQAVVGAQIQLYAAGSSGNGSAATPLLANPVVTGDSGSFDIEGNYTCPSPTAQIYIVATGGNPGSNGQNPALAMMAALGNCENLGANQFIFVNEVTTVAAAWALAPFTHSYTSIGASATNSLGLANAFLDANLIANTSNGQTATLPGNLTTETGKIDALADALASCIDSKGGSGCAPLFSAAKPSSGSAPENAFDAAIDIVKNPGHNVAGVFATIGPNPPFSTTLAQPPNDWTLSLTVTGGGLSEPTALGVDSQGNVWAADFPGLLSVFGPQGTPLSDAGLGSGTLSEDYGLTIDPSDNVWVSVEANPNQGSTGGSVVEFQGVSSGGTLGASTVFANSAIDYPFRIAADSQGNILIANNNGTAANESVTVLDPGTSVYTPYSGEGNIAGATAVAPDGAVGIWVANSLGASHIDSSGGTILQDCCGQSDGLALDSAGNVWVADYSQSDQADDNSNGAVTELAPDGTILQEFLTGGGIMNPSDVEVDAAQNVWITNFHSPQGQNQTFSELAGSTSANPGAAISPSTGYGLDANLVEPYALAIDPSGNIWISNEVNNDLVMFFGLAAPTRTPKPALPTAP